ncbi:PiggyBac transposable element-derived protein 4 [Araneus ventricosus]|uniref:PiggyBac transposable element-derived protein 4 n=1 Tax=Araneus ventricosus TaxID=182803 RepID=A0A4Y2CYZ0_ARAVE|nr:PiggyBac transposable element-derived protein 4 [Araneus ventricosus]
MGGVDKADECLSYYPTVRNQQKKYYLKIFRQILNQSVWNSFVLYKKNGGTMSHLDFRLQLVEELAKIYGESKHSSQNTTSSDRLTGRHFPSHIEPTQKKKAPTEIYIVCSQKFNEKGQRGTSPGSGPAMEESEHDVGSLEQLELYEDDHYLDGKLPLEDHLRNVLRGVEECH